MTTIILVRHGQNPWNKDKIFRGSRAIPLNDQGREGPLAGEWLREGPIHTAYCSPLSRARDTAEAICRRHGLKVEDFPGLTDLITGNGRACPSQR